MRYVVSTEFYIHAENPEEAIATAKMMAEEQRKRLDDQCKVQEVHTQPQGSFYSKKIYPE